MANLLNNVVHQRFRSRFAEVGRLLRERSEKRRALKHGIQDLFVGAMPHFRRLEPRRVLNAEFAFDGVDGLLLSNFTSDLGATSSLDLSYDVGATDFVFTLDGGVWVPGGTHVVDPLVTAAANVLRVDISLFTDAADVLDWNILDNAAVDDIALNFTVSTTIDLPNPTASNGTFTIDVDGFVDINAAINTHGNNLSITAEGIGNPGDAINSSGAITTTETTVDTGFASGNLSISATGDGDINLAAINTSGADHSGAAATASAAGTVTISTFDGGITLAGIDASGGNATGGGTGGAGAAVSITAADSGADEAHNVTLNGTSYDTSGGTGATANGAGANIDMTSDNNLTINAPILSGGGDVTLDAGGSVTSTLATDTITTTSEVTDGASGAVDIDAGTSINLAGAIATTGAATNGNGGNVNVDTVNGGVTLAGIAASRSGTGTGGNIAINANGTNADVILNGAITTNAAGTVTVTADDAITFNTGGSISATGTGDIAVTSNAEVVPTDGDSGDGITMLGASFINAGTAAALSGSILLRSTGANGGPIVAQGLTSRNNTIHVDSGDSVDLQGAVNSGGGLVNVDAVTSVALSTGSITTAALVADEASGAVDIDAGTAVTLTGNIVTSGIATNGNGGNVDVDTLNGGITAAGIAASAAGTGTSGSIILNANGTNSDVILNGALTTNAAGTVTVTADDAITFNTGGSISATGTGNIAVTSNAETVPTNGDSGDGITMNGASFINAGTGTTTSGSITLQSTGANGGAIAAQALTTRNNTITVNSGDSVNLQGAVNSGGGLVDIDAVTTVSSNAGGTITTTSVADSGLTSGAVAINAVTGINLLGAINTSGANHATAAATASAAGQVDIATTDGPISVSTINAAGGNATGGGASTGGAGANINITSADAGANDTHNVALNGALNTNGGTGATQGGAGNVKITADNDLLVAAAVNAGTGNVFLTAGGNATQTAAITASGLGLMVTGSTDLTNAGNNVSTLAASNGGQTLYTDADTLDIGSVTVAPMTATGVTAATGTVGITVLAGNLTSGSITATAGAIDIDVNAGDVTIGSISAGTTINIDTPLGSINDATDDATADLTAGGAITLTARDEIAGIGADGRLDFAAGSSVTASSTTAGDILLRGLGAVTLTSVTTANGAINVTAAGTTTATSVSSTGTDSDTNDVTLTTTAGGDIVVQSVLAGPTTGDVIISADGSILDGDTPGDDLDISGNDVTLTAVTGSIGVAGDIFKGTVNAIEVTASGDLVANATAGAIALNPTVTGTTTLNSPNVALVTTGTLNIDDLTVTGDLRVEAADVVANDGTINLTANRILFISGQAETIGVTTPILDARAGGDLVVTSTAAIELLDLDCDNVALGTTTAAGAITLTAPGTITISDDVIAGNDGTTVSTGTVSISATGAASDIVVNDIVLTDNGSITLQADEDIRFGGPLSGNDNLVAPLNDDLFVVTSVNGNITVTADNDGSGAGEVVMLDTSRIIAGRDISVADYVPNTDGNASVSVVQLGAVAKTAGQSQIVVTAPGNITIASIQTANNTANAVRITSTAGAILDVATLLGGDTHTDIIANFTGALTTLSAATGIGSTNAIETAVYAVDADNSGAGAIVLNEVAAGGDINVVNADNAGDVRIQADGGTLTVVTGGFTPTNGAFGVSSTTGNILLAASGDVVIDNTVDFPIGNLTLDAGDDVFINVALGTVGTGDIYIEADNNTAADAIGPAVDGINVDATLSTTTGSILLRSGHDIRTAATITSTGENVGLVAGNDVLQNADILATAGNILITAGNDYTMDLGASAAALTNIVATATAGTITLESLSAVNVGLTAGGDITDGNGGGVTNVTATNLSMRAGGIIGGSDTGSADAINNNAIDTNVTTLAANGASGVYVHEFDDLILDNVAAISVTVTVDRVNFDGTTPAESATGTALAVSATESSPGPIKIFAVGGSLTIDHAVTATAGGDVLLQALTDVIINAAVDGGTGNVTLNAGDDVDVNVSVTTAGTGDVYIIAANSAADAIIPEVDGVNINAIVSTTGTGNILVDSAMDIRNTANVTSGGDLGFVATNDILQNADLTATGAILLSAGGVFTMSTTAVTTGGTEVLARSTAGDLTLGRINGTTVSLDASGDIRDGNGGGTVNVVATNLRMVAGGSIGTSDLGSGITVNNNAIDTTVTTLAAQSADGIYIQETDGITVDHVNAVSLTITVTRVNFNSTTDEIDGSDALAALDDLTTIPGSDGSIKVTALSGTITVNDGTDVDGVGISADGSGDILLDARGANNDIVTTTGIVSGTGHITLQAADSITLGDDLLTTGAGTILVDALGGSISVADGGDVDLNGISADADILLRASATIAVNANVASSANDVGLVAGTNVLQNANVSGANVLVLAGNDYTMDLGATTTATTNIVATATAGSITLERLVGSNIGLTAGTDILDGDGGATNNVTATNLSMLAGGIIGGSDAGAAGTNDNAIDTAVDILAAQSASGIYILEANDVTIDHVDAFTVSIDGVTRVNFNSSTDPEPTVSLSSTARDDLTTTTDGPIKLVSAAGFITANDGTDGDGFSVSANGTGDILLHAFTDLTINASVESGTGNITLHAGDDVDVNATVATTGDGDIFVVAANSAADAVGPEVDGINVDAAITTADGNILLDSAADIRITAAITSGSGDIGLVASQDVLQNTDVTTTGGNILVNAGRDYVMAATVLPTTITTSTSGGNILVRAVRDARVASLDAGAGNVSIDAGRDILDQNADSRVNIIGTNLRMVAGQSIGGTDLGNAVTSNDNAINTTVTRLAAQSATGIYVQETDGLTIDNVAAMTITVTATRANFNSSREDIDRSHTLATLDDLTTTSNGPIKVTALAGTITVHDGNDGDELGVSAHGTGDILLDARGVGSDIVTTTGVVSGTGHIHLQAADSVTLGDDVVTTGAGTIFVEALAGSVSVADGADLDTNGISAAADILLRAATTLTIDADVTSTANDVGLVAGTSVLQNADVTGANVLVQAGTDYSMGAGATTTATAAPGNIVVNAGGTISLQTLTATNVGLTAGVDILDGDLSAANNITATNLSMLAGGIIGGSDLGSAADTNNNAIDTNVSVLAAQSATGIYVLEANAITIDHVDAFTVNVDVTRVNFNSSTDAEPQVTLASTERDDLTTTINGPIKVTSLAGTITVNDGTDGDELGVSAHGTGDILLDARGAGSDIVTTTGVVSGTGHIHLQAADSVTLGDDVVTTGAGTIFVEALAGSVSVADGVDLDTNGISAAADILLRAATTLTIDADVTSASNVGLVAGTSVLQNADVTGANVLVQAGASYSMGAGATTTATAAPGNIVVNAGGTISLQILTATNVGLTAGVDILDGDLSAANNITATNLSMLAGGIIGGSDLGSAADTNNNAIDTNVSVLAAQSATGIYVLEANAITIDHVAAFTVDVDVTRVNFNSSTDAEPQVTLASTERDDLTTTTNGPIKLTTSAGTITVNDGTDGDELGVSAHGTGDILLDARGAGSDIVTTTGVVSGTGHIHLQAADSVTLGDDVVTTGAGTIFVEALAGSVSVADGADFDTNGISAAADILLRAATTLTIDADVTSASNVGLVAGTSVLQNADVTGANVLVQAGASYSMGAGVTTIANAAPTSNIVVNAGGTISLQSLTATNVGLTAGVDIVDGDGSATINITATNLSMRAGGTIGGPVAGNEIDTTVAVLAAQSATGIYVLETDDITIGRNAPISVSVNANRVNFNSSTIPEPVVSTTAAALEDLTTSSNGSIQLESGGTITLTAGTSTGAISAHGTGDVSLTAAGAIREATNTATVAGDALSLDAGTYAFLHTNVNTLTAEVGSNSTLTSEEVQNSVANDTGDDFLDQLTAAAKALDPAKFSAQIAAIEAEIAAQRANFQYDTKLNDQYALFVKNSGNLTVNNVTAGNGTTETPNIYIETVDGGDLTVAGQVRTNSSTADEGGIVLIAGEDLSINAAGSLVTSTTVTMQQVQTIGASIPSLAEPYNDHVLANFFDGGEGIEPDNDPLTTTQFVVKSTATVTDYRTQILQRVVIQFGATGEAGFTSFVAYADGKVQQFDVAEPANASPMPAFPRMPANVTAALFTRTDAFDSTFLDNNPVLPTMAILRRANDFFLFEAGGTKDMAVETSEIANVRSLGSQGGLALPTDPVLPPTLGFVPTPTFVSIENFNQQVTTEIELEAPTTKSITVAIYRVGFIDGDMDGQVDSDELPSYEYVLSEEGIDSENEAKRIVIESKEGETPTREEIEREKNALLEDPNQPSGAYAIIKEDADGNQTVLEVFGVRDWPEEQEDDEEKDAEVEIPKLPPFDPNAKGDEDKVEGAELVPPPVDGPQNTDSSRFTPNRDSQTSRFASSGLLLGSLMMLRNKSESTAPSARTESTKHDFSRRARRRRQLGN